MRAKKRNQLGLFTVGEIAGLPEKDLASLDGALGVKGRALRDDWIGQARAMLAD